MSDYEKVVDDKGVTRYKLGGKFVKSAEVPEDVKASLNDVVSDNEIEEPVAEVEEVVAVEEVVEEAEVVDPGASPDDVDDESGIDEEVTVSSSKAQEEGMGFKRVKGKTVDIFDGKTPHEAVRFVGGLTVPVTKENYDKKTDAEILAQLKKIGKA